MHWFQKLLPQAISMLCLTSVVFVVVFVTCNFEWVTVAFDSMLWISTVWCTYNTFQLLHGWCHMNWALPFQCTFLSVLHHATIHQFTVSLHGSWAHGSSTVSCHLLFAFGRMTQIFYMLLLQHWIGQPVTDYAWVGTYLCLVGYSFIVTMCQLISKLPMSKWYASGVYLTCF